MTLAAADLGIGSGHSAVASQQQAQRVLGFPDGYLAVCLIGPGYPADRPLQPISKPTGGPLTRLCTGTTGNTEAQFKAGLTAPRPPAGCLAHPNLPKVVRPGST